MKFVSTLSLLLVAAMAMTSFAQETCKQCPASKAAQQCTAGKQCSACPASTVSTSAQDESCETCGSKTACSTCAVSQAMAKLPKMTYRVGTESTCCSESASALAKKHGKPVQFVVGDQTFDDESKAFVSLVENTEAFVNEFVTPKKCETSGTTSIAGQSCACPVQAGELTAKVKQAVEQVKMGYKVGDKSACCSQSAQALAKQSGQPVTYVVNSQEHSCNYQARLELAKARYAAAVKSLLAANTAKAGSEVKVGK